MAEQAQVTSGEAIEAFRSSLIGDLSKARPTLEEISSDVLAAHRAQHAVREAEEKQRVLKKWERELEGRTGPMVKLIDQLHGFLNSEMVKAVAYLGEVVETLQAYAEVQAPAPAPTPALQPAS